MTIGNRTKIIVVGIGYVGLSNAVLLAQKHDVTAVDISAQRVEMLNAGRSPIADRELEALLSERTLRLHATTDLSAALPGSEFVIIATPTNYDPNTNRFDTHSVEEIVNTVTRDAPEATIVIKSTVPVGFVDRLRMATGNMNIIFSPEFLREGSGLYDNLYPSRIIVGDTTEQAKRFASMMHDGAQDKAVPVLFMSSSEAEAVKLFSNTYLAMRIAFFNELDSFAIANGIDTRKIIEAVCRDPRIGGRYNNPSFGYGGYCLPKDTKQLLANFTHVPQKLIEAIVEANHTRKDFLAEQILLRAPKTIGIYRLVMKAGSDNVRQSSVLGIMKRLKAEGVEVIVYEPVITEEYIFGSRVLRNLAKFKRESDIIVANRITADIEDVIDKTYSRDLFGRDI